MVPTGGHRSQNDGRWGFYVDSKRLNGPPISDSYPSQQMVECIDLISDAGCNVTQGNIAVREDHRYNPSAVHVEVCRGVHRRHESILVYV